MDRHFVNRNHQTGVMLLEALIAILIFSVGILAIVGLQANSIKLAGDAKYRSEANILANQLIGNMWQSQSASQAAFAAAYAPNTGGSFNVWKNTLPSPFYTDASSVIIAPASSAAASTVSDVVTINLYWKTPGDATTHIYTTQTQINH